MKLPQNVKNRLLKVRENYRDIRATHYLKNIKKKKNSKHKTLKIAFIVFEPETWDKQAPVYEEFKKRKIPTDLIVVPSFNIKLCLIKEYGKEWDFFHKYDSNAIKAYDDNLRLINIKKRKYDYVFYQDPYNAHMPKELKSNDVFKHSKICYVPYGYTVAENFSDLIMQNRDFFRTVSYFFSDSESVSKVVEKIFINSENCKYQNILNLGYPGFEKYINLQNTNIIDASITWAPRWTYDENVGGSHFIEYKEKFISLREKYADISLIVRPHPMLFENMKKTGYMTENSINEYKLKLKNNKILLMDQGATYDVFKQTQILISDISSVIPSFFMTGRPIIYCKSNLEINKEFDELLKGIYVADSWEDVEKYLDMLLNGNDPLKTIRGQIINNGIMSAHKGAEIRIVDYLIEQFEKYI